MTISTAPDLDPARLAQTFDAIADAAAGMTLPLFRSAMTVNNKHATGFDPVTAADIEAEQAIRDVIAVHFPDHAIVGEEHPAKATASPFTWIIDPIDGTRAFISGVPVWGTLVGLAHKGRAIAGMMDQPFLGERWQALNGRTRYTRGPDARPVRTSNVTRLGAAKATTTSPDMFATGPREAAWRRMAGSVLQVRYGLDCYGYCLLASGHIDLVVEADLKDVDIAPLIPIIEGAGGVVTTWDGEAAERGGTCVAAATPELHAEALALLGHG